MARGVFQCVTMSWLEQLEAQEEVHVLILLDRCKQQTLGVLCVRSVFVSLCSNLSLSVCSMLGLTQTQGHMSNYINASLGIMASLELSISSSTLCFNVCSRPLCPVAFCHQLMEERLQN